MLFIFISFTDWGKNRTDHTASSSLASSFRIASGTSSPCSFVDTRSGECGAGPECDAGVDGSQGLACLSCLPSRFWCAHNKHNAARQQNPAMHAMMMPAISPDAIAAARARAEALMEALPGSSFGKKTQARASLSRKDQENMIARSNRAFQTGIGPGPYPSPAVTLPSLSAAALERIRTNRLAAIQRRAEQQQPPLPLRP